MKFHICFILSLFYVNLSSPERRAWNIGYVQVLYQLVFQGAGFGRQEEKRKKEGGINTRIHNRVCHHYMLLVALSLGNKWLKKKSIWYSFQDLQCPVGHNFQYGALIQGKQLGFPSKDIHRKDTEQEARGCCDGLENKLKVLLYVKLVMPTLSRWKRDRWEQEELK